MTSHRCRRLKTISLVCLTALVWLWVVSFHADVYCYRPVEGWRWSLELSGGKVRGCRMSNFYRALRPVAHCGVVWFDWYQAAQRSLPLTRHMYWFVLPYVHVGTPSSPGDVSISTPFWLPMCPLGVLLAWTYRQERRLRDSAACKTCGYNLTGNLSGICPECGSPTAARPPGPV